MPLQCKSPFIKLPHILRPYFSYKFDTDPQVYQAAPETNLSTGNATQKHYVFPFLSVIDFFV